MGKQWKQWQILFSWAEKSLQMVTAAMKLKDASSLEENYDKPRQHIKKQRHHFADKGPYSQSCGFSSSYVWMWELDCKEGWTLKNWCFQIVVLEKTLESPLDCKEIKAVNSKGNHNVVLNRKFFKDTVTYTWSVCSDGRCWLTLGKWGVGCGTAPSTSLKINPE